MDVLGIDLGTNTGYCYNHGGQITCGTWTLATSKEVSAWGKTRQRRTGDPRIDRLCDKIDNLGYFDIVAFEDVQFGSSTYQTQLWASLRASVWLCARAGVAIECVPVGTLKKFATGHGGATKEAMLKAMKRDNPEFFTPNFPLDDNAIDAYFVWKWATKTLARTTA